MAENENPYKILDRSTLEHIKAVDQKIAHNQAILDHHQAILIDLNVQRNRLRNRLIPISRIPLELLYRIFFIASRDEQCFLDDGTRWIKLTHVCHEWRDLALASPHLWSNPTFQNPRWAQEMLIRSGPVDLTVEAASRIFNSPGKLDNFFDTLMTHTSRIKCIKLTFPLFPSKDVLGLLPEYAPNLESLTLLIDKELMAWDLEREFILPSGCLCKINNLRRMQLEGINLNWGIDLPGSLTSLKLSNIWYHSSLTTSVQIWDALGGLPLLEVLELSEALPISQNPVPANKSVCLDHLQRLKLVTGFAQTECFLQSITFPSNTLIDIECLPVGSPAYINLNGVVELLGQSLQGCSPNIFATLQFQCFSNGFHVIAPISTSTKESSKTSFNFRLKCRWRWSEGDSGSLQNPQEEEKIVINIFQYFPFESVTHLIIERLVPLFSIATLLRTVGESLPRLQSMEVQSFGYPILDALQPRSAVPGTFAAPGISFPSLQKMVLTHAIFHDSPDHSQDEVSVDDLIGYLRFRQQNGAGVKAVDLKQCFNLDESKVQGLRDSLEGTVEVVWDGKLETGGRRHEEI